MLAGVSSAMPALLEAYKLSSRAAQVGFDWPNIEGLFDKLHEETDELARNSKKFPRPAASARARHGRIGANCRSPKNCSRLEEEVGDLVLRAGEHRALSVAWILSLLCARPIASSSAAFSGWKSACTRPDAPPIRLPWKNSSRCGSRRKRTRSEGQRRRPRDRRLRRTPPLPRHRGIPRLRGPAEGSLELHRCRTGPLAHVRRRRQSRRPGHGSVRWQ